MKAVDSLELPGYRLRELRAALSLSQERLADLLRTTGDALGEPNGCSKRLVQKWEHGKHRRLSPPYRRVLEEVSGLSYADLCDPGVDLLPGPSMALPDRLGRLIVELGLIREQLVKEPV